MFALSAVKSTRNQFWANLGKKIDKISPFPLCKDLPNLISQMENFNPAHGWKLQEGRPTELIPSPNRSKAEKIKPERKY